MEFIGFPILKLYNLMDKFELVKKMYMEKDVLVVFTAAFTPIPYKLITITAGAVQLNIVNFIAASFVGRAARFFLVATAIYFFGERVKGFLEKYLNLLTILFFVLLILGFIAVKYLIK
jgi:membrane protein YqaA with SNARE-associated domain